MTTDTDTSVRATLTAAIAGLKGEEAPAPEPVVEPVAAAPAEDPQPESEAASEGAPARDDRGRFAAKTEQAAAASAEAPAVAAQDPAAKETESQDETIRVPHALPAPLKAKFRELPAEWRDAFAKQEDSIQAFKDEQAPKAARLNRYDEIIGPHVDRWRSAGMDEFSGVQTLIAAQNLLDRDPLNGILNIARSYGYTPQHLAQALGGQQAGNGQTTAPGAPQAPTLSPDLTAALQPVVQGLQTLQQRFDQQTKDAEAASAAAVNAEVARFRADPKNIYFENVKGRMGQLIASGDAKDLGEAYEQAIWADPTIRPLLLAEQAKPAAPQVDPVKVKAEQDRRKAAEAAKAAGSVTGAPTGGLQPPKEPPGSVRDSIRAAMHQHGAQV